MQVTVTAARAETAFAPCPTDEASATFCQRGWETTKFDHVFDRYKPSLFDKGGLSEKADTLNMTMPIKNKMLHNDSISCAL